MNGYVQVYTGNGKGKSTAAFGLSIRAAGAGLKVFIAQFMKKGDYSEIKALKRVADFITVEQFGLGRFIKGKPLIEDIKSAHDGLKKTKSIMLSGKYDVVILDEANICTAQGLFSTYDLIDMIDAKPDNVELVITGRNAASEIIEKADIVTEMKEIKHYFQKGIVARIGIEK